MMNLKRFKTGAVVLLAVGMLSGCAGTDFTGKKGQVGAVGGAAGGALLGQAIGKNTESTLIGAAVGTMFGYMIGNEMDKFDLTQVNNAFENAPSNKPVAWSNPDTNASYSMTPEPVYKAPSGQHCRNAEVVAFIDGKEEIVNMTACRDAYGNWQKK